MVIPEPRGQNYNENWECVTGAVVSYFCRRWKISNVLTLKRLPIHHHLHARIQKVFSEWVQLRQFFLVGGGGLVDERIQIPI